MPEWEEYKEYLSGCVTGFVAGFAIGSVSLGISMGLRSNKPRSVYVRDVNEDQKQDVIIKTHYYTYIFLGQEDNTFKILEDVQSESTEVVKKDIEDIRTRAAESLKSKVE